MHLHFLECAHKSFIFSKCRRIIKSIDLYFCFHLNELSTMEPSYSPVFFI